MTAPHRRNGLAVDAIQRRCASKKRYPDEMTCIAAGLHFISIGQIDKLWRYKCKICGGGWHLTKLDNGPRNAIHNYLTNDALVRGAKSDTNERTDDRAGT